MKNSRTAPGPNDDAALVRALPWQWASTGLNTVFGTWALGSSVFLLFLSELGLPKAQIGVVLSVFPFCGLLALWFAPLARRLGRKRVFLVCFGSRKVVIAGLLLLPVIVSRRGAGAGLAWLLATIVVFAVLRALAETAYYPWSQEVIPNRVRGMSGAVTTLVSTGAGSAAVLIAGRVIAAGTGTGRFLVLIGAGCVVGLASVALMVPVPGGMPEPAATEAGAHLVAMRRALKDQNFVLYLAGLGCVTVGTQLVASFLPLYLRERLGVPPGAVVTLDTAVMLGGAVAGLGCGWAADRLGSRPVLMPALALNLLVPLGWLLLPRQTPHVLGWCAALYVGSGVASAGVSIGAGRLLFNGVVPQRSNTAYTAIYYAWMGLSGGVAPLAAGAILGAWGEDRGFAVGPLAADGHTVLFALALVLLALGWWLYGRVKPDGAHTTRTALRRALRRLAGGRRRSAMSGGGDPGMNEHAAVVAIALGEPIVVARARAELDRAAGGWGRWQFPFLDRLADGTLHVSFSVEPDSSESYGRPMGHAYSSDGGRTWRMGPRQAGHEAGHGVLLPNGERLKPVQLPSRRAEELDLPPSVSNFVCSYGYPRSLYRAVDLPEGLASWRFGRLPAGGGWIEETAVMRIPGELRCVTQETSRGATPGARDVGQVRYGSLPLPCLWGKMRVAPDGSLWAVTYEWRLYERTPRYAPLFLRSLDYGRTWDLLGEIRYQGDALADPHAARRDGFTEPDFAFMPDGSVICLMRTMDGHGHGPLYLTRSADGGRTWSAPVVFDSFGKMPQLLTLGSGITLASYGASGGPGYFVVRATVDPSGLDWQEPVRTAVSPAEPGAWDTCGHTEMVALKDHRALIVYSDFNRPDEHGVRRKTIVVRTISVNDPASPPELRGRGTPGSP